MISLKKKKTLGAGEMAQESRTLDALTSDLSLVPRFHIASHNYLGLQPPEIRHPLLDSTNIHIKVHRAPTSAHTHTDT